MIKKRSLYKYKIVIDPTKPHLATLQHIFNSLSINSYLFLHSFCSSSSHEINSITLHTHTHSNIHCTPRSSMQVQQTRGSTGGNIGAEQRYTRGSISTDVGASGWGAWQGKGGAFHSPNGNEWPPTACGTTSTTTTTTTYAGWLQ